MIYDLRSSFSEFWHIYDLLYGISSKSLIEIYKNLYIGDPKAFILDINE